MYLFSHKLCILSLIRVEWNIFHYLIRDTCKMTPPPPGVSCLDIRPVNSWLWFVVIPQLLTQNRPWTKLCNVVLVVGVSIASRRAKLGTESNYIKAPVSSIYVKTSEQNNQRCIYFQLLCLNYNVLLKISLIIFVNINKKLLSCIVYTYHNITHIIWTVCNCINTPRVRVFCAFDYLINTITSNFTKLLGSFSS